ncbi:hypothetical protein Tco_0533078 [Tanacetum coccineum]
MIEKMNKKAAGEDTSRKEKVLEEPDSSKMEVKQEEVEESTRKRPEDKLWQNQERWNLKSWDFYENCGVHTLILEDGTEIHMLAKRKYPLTKETLEKMMSLKLVAEFVSDGAYNLLRSIQKHQELASPDQTASGKDFSNPLMDDSLPKTICCYKDDKDWKLMNVKYYKVTKEFKFIKEQIKEYLCVWIHPRSDQEALTEETRSTANTSVRTGSRVCTVSIIVSLLVSLDLSKLATTLNRLERSIQIGINIP